MTAILIGITFIFSIAWLLAALLRARSAALRHLVWMCTFAAVLLLPLLRWRVPHRAISTSVPAFAVISVNASEPVRTDLPTSTDPATILLGVWIFGTVVMTLRLARNAVQLRSVIRSAEGAGPIRISSRIRGPVVASLLRPVILLPDTSDTWTADRRRAVLAHETAHIRRSDPAILFLSHIATALYWFHPLCWLAAARLRAESESACDDAALRLGLQPSGYAGHLLDLARRFDTQLAIPMATTSHLESRVKSILSPKTNRSFPARATWLAALLLTALVLAPLSMLTLRAQQSAGAAAIAGTVTDPTGAVVPVSYTHLRAHET